MLHDTTEKQNFKLNRKNSNPTKPPSPPLIRNRLTLFNITSKQIINIQYIKGFLTIRLTFPIKSEVFFWVLNVSGTRIWSSGYSEETRIVE